MRAGSAVVMAAGASLEHSSRGRRKAAAASSGPGTAGAPDWRRKVPGNWPPDVGSQAGSLGRVGRRRPVPPKLYRIGELTDYSGVSRQTIHNYTTMGLLRESRWTDGGHRLYDESVFERLDMIATLKRQGRSLRYMREHFARLDVK